MLLYLTYEVVAQWCSDDNSEGTVPSAEYCDGTGHYVVTISERVEYPIPNQESSANSNVSSTVISWDDPPTYDEAIAMKS